MLKTECYSLGDLHWKRFGVTPEPDVRAKLLNGKSPSLFGLGSS